MAEAEGPAPVAARGRRHDRRLWVTAALAVTALALGGAALLATRDRGTSTLPDPGGTRFAPYVFVTPGQAFPVEEPAAKPARGVVLGFVVAGPDERCTPSWGTHYSLEEAAGPELDLDASVRQLRARSRDVIVSFGGAAHSELALRCPDAEALAGAYAQVVDRYALTSIEFDIEGTALDDAAANARRADAARQLQDRARATGKALTIGLTLPVAERGLTAAGAALLDEMLRAGVEVGMVNAMTMNFAGSASPGTSMYEVSSGALDATFRQVSAAYARAGSVLTEEAVWARMGATPMIGQNDVAGEVFTLDDARQLRAYADDRKLGRLSMWSTNRDIACPGPTGTTASSSCSGVAQEPSEFAQILGSASPRPSPGTG